MNDLVELYGELIKDHKSKPRNFGKLEGANREVKGHNPLCGDRFTIYLSVNNDVVDDVKFEGDGCAISTASASIMTESIKGKSVDDVHQIFHTFHDVVMGKTEPNESMGKLAAFAGVRAFPMRVKCATLSWHAMENALKGSDIVAQTE